MGDKNKHDKRPLWEKLLDPIREMYGDVDSDYLLLRRVIFDHQVILSENEKLNRIIASQAKVLRRHGWGGYGRCES